MLVGIHQLHYLPWLRYAEKIARSDVFVVLDNVQFTKNDWQNRNKLKTASGATVLTVPVFERFGQTLDEVRIKDSVPWRKKHWRTIEQNYRKAPFFDAHQAFLADTYAREWTRLNALNRHMLDYFVQALGIDTRVVYASDLGGDGAASERLAGLVRAVGGDCYYSGAFAIEQYLDHALFEAAGIGLKAQEWTAPKYPQRHGAFVPDLAILDLLLNCGPESLSILCGGAA
ncbi:MAG: hypothetical protein GWP08_12870 [Nitrospiraceae bacterium]|nr:hypothetical protein [Nitrospiraceae bacterium]